MFKEAIQAQQESDDKYKWPEMTIGHLIRAIMSVQSAVDAKQFYDEYVAYLRTTPDLDPRGAEYVANVNVGWCFGEGMADEKRRMWKSLGAFHPALPL